MKKNKASKVKKHLKEDIKMFHHEAAEDKKLIKELNKKSAKKKVASKKRVVKKKAAPKRKKRDEKEKPGHEKFEKVLKEFKEGKLHSGSKKGPKVKKKSQAYAIAFSEDRRADKTNKGAKKKKKK